MLKKILLGVLLCRAEWQPWWGAPSCAPPAGSIRLQKQPTTDRDAGRNRSTTLDNQANGTGNNGQGNQQNEASGGQGNGNGGQGNGGGSGQGNGGGSGQGNGGERQYPAYDDTIVTLETVSGSVVQAPAAGEDLVLLTTAGEELVVGAGPTQEGDAILALTVGDQLEIDGYWEARRVQSHPHPAPGRWPVHHPARRVRAAKLGRQQRQWRRQQWSGRERRPDRYRSSPGGRLARDRRRCGLGGREHTRRGGGQR